ncbi:MAG TPA: prepilin peptidase, partial [Thermoanaerobaculia bacterium]
MLRRRASRHNPAVTLDAFLQVYAALFGLIAGSYLNVVVYRLPRGISTVLPRSRCPRCR